jgi:Flp pilus assembly protein TadB
MTDRCPVCNSIHFYTKRDLVTKWDSSNYTTGEKPARPAPVADDHSKMIVECLDCGFNCLYSSYPKEKARLEKQKKSDEEQREIAYTRSKIKMLYEAGKIEEAEEFYLKKNNFTDRLPNIEAVYRSMSKSNTTIIVISILVFVLILSFMVWLLEPYSSIIIFIGVFVALFFVLKFVVKQIIS